MLKTRGYCRPFLVWQRLLRLLEQSAYCYLSLMNCGQIKPKQKSYISRCQVLPFSQILPQKNDVSGFDLIKAQRMYAPESKATENRQTAEWNRALKKSRDAGWGNVIEAECLQLMTRDICMSTISLLTMTGKVLVVLMIVYMSVWNPIKMLAIPLAYLVAMLFVSRTAAMKRADRLVTIVIKNDVQMQGCDSG